MSLPALPAAGLLLLRNADVFAPEALGQCDLLLVCGSSLGVMPVSGFAWEVSHRGGSVAIVNRGPTEADGIADLRIEAGLGDVLGEVRRAILG